jgi:hypothetical protein
MGRVGELRAGDWIAADGNLTIVGQCALRRWSENPSSASWGGFSAATPAVNWLNFPGPQRSSQIRRLATPRRRLSSRGGPLSDVVEKHLVQSETPARRSRGAAARVRRDLP